MPFFKPKAPPQNDADTILDSIASGQFDDDTINRLCHLADISEDNEVDRIADALLANIVKTDDRNVLIGTVKALTVLPFMPEGKDESVIRLMVTLFSVPQNTRMTLQHKMLQSEILKYLLSMLKTNERYAHLMMTELIASLEYAYITNDADAYPVLESLAAKRPEYFRPHTETLIKLLGSINKKTRAQSAKLIGIIGAKYPEYVSGAMPVLQSLASFYPDAHVKHNASEAYQILYHGLKLDVIKPVVVKEDDRHKHRSVGFADILKKKAADLLSKPHEPGRSARGSSGRGTTGKSSSRDRPSRDRPDIQDGPGQPEEELNITDMEGFETEIKEILDKTREDFTIDAEGILDSIGVGHLSIKSRAKSSASTPTDSTTALDGGTATATPQPAKRPIHARSSNINIEDRTKPDENLREAVHKEAHAETHKAHVETGHKENKPHGETPKAEHHQVAHSPPIRAGFKSSEDLSKETDSLHVPASLPVVEKPVEKKSEAQEPIAPAHHSAHHPRPGTHNEKLVPEPVETPKHKDPDTHQVVEAAKVAQAAHQHEKHPKTEPAPYRVKPEAPPAQNAVTPIDTTKSVPDVKPSEEARPSVLLPPPEALKTNAAVAKLKHEKNIEAPVLPPKASSRPIVPQSPIAPVGGRKIAVSKPGMIEKPLESNEPQEEGKKEAVVPGTSISGFGQNKQIYKCPKCGARTMAEGELCKICKMTMERPQQMVRCERCSLMNNRYARFCRKCGAKLDKDKNPTS